MQVAAGVVYLLIDDARAPYSYYYYCCYLVSAVGLRLHHHNHPRKHKQVQGKNRLPRIQKE